MYKYKVRNTRYRRESPIKITHIDGKEIVPVKQESRLQSFFKNADPKQVRSGKNIIIFVAVMLVLTVVARGSSAATLATVTTAKYSSAEVITALTGTGTVKSSSNIDITVPQELTIKEVLAEVGQTVAPGDGLLRFDTAEIDEKIATLKNEIKKNELSYSELTGSTSHDSTNLAQAQSSLQWAREDLSAAKKNGDKLVSDAESALADAKKALADAENALANYIPPVQSTGDEGEDSVPAQEDKTSDLQSAVDLANQNVSSAVTALDNAKQQREESVKAAERAISSAELALQSAQKSDSDSLKNEENSKNKNLADAETVQMEIDKQKKQLAPLEDLRANDGVLKAAEEGSISEIVNAGEKSADTAVVKMLGVNGDYIAEMTVDKEWAEKLTTGSEAEIIYNNGSAFASQVLSGTVVSISAGDENVKLKVKLPQKEWKEGESVDIRVISSSDYYDCTVPVGAVRSDNSGNFVYVVDERATVLGVENVLRRVEITVKNSDDVNAAVEGNIGYDEKVLVTSTKPVSENSHVRVQDE